MANGILVFIEHVDGKINRASYEAVRAAQLIGPQIGQEISAVVFGQGVGDVAAEVATKQIKTVYTVESEWLKSYTADGYTSAFKQVIEQMQPAMVLMTHTYEVRDFAPKLAASMKRMLLGDNIGYKIEDGRVVFTRQIFQGKLAADVAPTGDAPYLVSFQIGTFRGDECNPKSDSKKPKPPLI
jgi:electron transfer flavoprotein alpha subunit